MVDKNAENKIFTPDNWSVILFLTALIFLISMWDIHIFLQDEKPLVNQLVNLEYGSLSLDRIKIPLGAAWSFEKDGATYSVYSHAVPIFAMPFYLILYFISFFIEIAMFFALFWSLLIILLGYSLARKFNNGNILKFCIVISFFILGLNLFLYKPIPFDAWGELISIQFFNILITSAGVVLIYQLFRAMFNENSGLFAAIVFLFATPYSFWGVGVKEHALSIFLSLASFFFFYNYLTLRNPGFVYTAYGLSGIIAWGRVFDALPLFFSLYFVDIFFVKGFFKEPLKGMRFRQARSFFNYSVKIFVIMVIALLPYFINNYLVIGNPVFFLGYGPQAEITVATPLVEKDIKTGILAVSDYSMSILKTLRIIPVYFDNYWSKLGLEAVTKSIFRIFYIPEVPVKSSIFQINPLLSIILPISIIFLSKLRRTCKLQGGSFLKAIGTGLGLMDILFILMFILVFVFYMPFNYKHSDGFSYDYRYFAIFYIPLIYWAVRSLNAMFPSYVEVNLGEIFSLFFASSYLTLFSLILLSYMFLQPGFSSIILLIKSTGLLYVLLIIVFTFVHNESNKENYLKYVISVCLSLSFSWVFMSDILGRGEAYDRGVSMMLPISQYIHEFLRLLLTTPLLR
ncbi:MAG: hypothetical protein OIN66_16765 [Candidatus Methanoperedens sp.]|nr:hypothetical protein [Candidatus Methanoperedens sp.]